MSVSGANVGRVSVTSQAYLLDLQSKARADPESYAVEITQQFAHFKSAAAACAADPVRPPPELKALLVFLAHVLPAVDETSRRNWRRGVASACVAYEPDECVREAPTMMLNLLRDCGPTMEASSRRALGKAVVQLHARGLLQASEVLPLCFSLFRCRDFTLRTLLFKHVVSHLSKEKGGVRGAVAGFLYRMVLDDDETAAKKSLAVVMELYRNNTWRDGKAVGIVAAAVGHKSGSVVRAACNFFLGHDVLDDNDDDSEDDDDDDDGNYAAMNAISREDVYKASKKGTLRTKKKKQDKLKKVQKAAKKAARKASNDPQKQGFTAIQLLDDPQGFAERVYERLKRASEPFETRLIMMQVISRTVGVHQLLLLNLYPLLQRYMQPHQRNVTVVLASLVQACHEGVPPDVLEPVLRQLLDGFISDKSRPEVMTVGIKTVREMAFRCPLLLGKDLLSDLVEYKKYRDKGVSAAARGLISLYREVAPHMLHKRERGRGADLSLRVAEFGTLATATRVDGAELLERAEMEDEDAMTSDQDIDIGGEDGMGGDMDEEDDEGDVQPGQCASGDDDDEGDDEGDDDSGSEDEAGGDDDGVPLGSMGGAGGAGEEKREAPRADSLRSLRRAAKAAAANESARADAVGEGSSKRPIEQTRFLTNEDFSEIKRMKTEAAIDALSSRYGARAVPASERRMRPEMLEPLKMRGHDKVSRLATVMKGREDRGEFGASTDRKKKKTGGLSNKEKAKKKMLPKGVQNKLARSRAKTKKRIGTKKNKKLY